MRCLPGEIKDTFEDIFNGLPTFKTSTQLQGECFPTWQPTSDLDQWFITDFKALHNTGS